MMAFAGKMLNTPKSKPLHSLRPWSVDSLNGGSIDALKKAPVAKKIGQLRQVRHRSKKKKIK